MTATPAQPYSPSEPRVPRLRRTLFPAPAGRRARRASGPLSDALALAALPLVAALATFTLRNVMLAEPTSTSSRSNATPVLVAIVAFVP